VRICWFNDNRLGLVEGNRVRDASTALEQLPRPAYPFPSKGAWASSYYTLWPGDIIMSGTCSGVSQVKPSDVLHCEIDKVAQCDVRILE
jgi:hypothetical protein